MRAVIYARYSCDNQREESIEGQLRECREFATRKGYTLVGSYIDRAVSAKTDNRPEFQRIVKESSGGLFDMVIEYFLSTKLFCGECGSLMVGDSGTSRNGRKYNYYKCTNVKHKDGCHKKSVRKEIIEDLVLNEVLNTMFTDEVISEISDKVIALQGRENTAIPLLNERLAEIKQRIENLVNAMEMGIVTKSTKEHLDELEAERERIESDILKEQIQRDLLTQDQIEFWLRSMKNLDLTTDDNKRRLVDTFVNSVYLYDDNKAIVSFNCREGYYFYYLLNYKSEKAVDMSAKSDDKIQQKTVMTALQSEELKGVNMYRREVGVAEIAFDSELAAWANYHAYLNSHDGYEHHDWFYANDAVTNAVMDMYDAQSIGENRLIFGF